MRELKDIDWAAWVPTVRATLLFIVRGGQVLLIRKKRGLGAGKINGPGGKLDPGETAAECAVRETFEELGVRALDPTEAGHLYFEFVDGLRLFCTVFTATRFEGVATETEEAIPLWTPISAIPFDEMWADDRFWLPQVLAGQRVTLRAVFDDDLMLDHAVEFDPRVP